MIKENVIPMKFHPRAFAAFGSDLVTNDAVALTELVKNCYDAYANLAAVVFGSDLEGSYIEIIDDGLGMTQEIVKEAWAVIATPYKMNHPRIRRNGKERIVSGNKGLGRFSAARLGKKLRIITYNESDICFSVDLDWTEFLAAESISNCKLFLKEYDQNKLISKIKNTFKSKGKRKGVNIKDINTGTVIRIYDLNEEWSDDKKASMETSLSRLISPFEKVSDFSIFLDFGAKNQCVEIKAHKFIKKPVYRIWGSVNNNGEISWNYTYAPKGKVIKHRKNKIIWEETTRGFDKSTAVTDLRDTTKNDPYCCGPFSYEIRAWDLDADSIADIHDAFNIQKKEIRQTISRYKGISIYRDNVLVLPKSEASRDWLGIDIRRVSSLGKRLSTSQMIGIISVTSEGNPGLKDTTDREKLVDTIEYKQFCQITESIIVALENLRNLDKKSNDTAKKETLSDLLTPLSTLKLESDVQQLVKSGGTTDDILEVIHEYSADTEKNLGELNDRLIYYAQTASLGSVALVVMHEIRLGMTVIKRFLNRIKLDLPKGDKRTEEYFVDAESSHQRLLDVADSFAPLYKRDLFKEKNQTSVKLAIEKSIRLIQAKKEAKNVLIIVDIQQDYTVAMHTGELQTILINLLDNACYWLRNVDSGKIRISIKNINEKRIEISVSDNGPGVTTDEKQKIFQPGVTAKLHGIGMGLVIVTELLNNHNGKIGLEIPGEMGGATFVFDVPVI